MYDCWYCEVKKVRELKTEMDEKVGRNDPCPCGSGKKFKKCCYQKFAKKKGFTAQVLGEKSATKTLGTLFEGVKGTLGKTAERERREKKNLSDRKQKGEVSGSDKKGRGRARG